MKTLPRKLAAAILTLVLATSAFAGQIQCPGAASTGTGTDTTEITETSTIDTADITMTIILIAVTLPPY